MKNHLLFTVFPAAVAATPTKGVFLFPRARAKNAHNTPKLLPYTPFRVYATENK